MKTTFTDPFIKNLNQPGRFTDAATTGLNLNIKANGGKYWVFRYLFGGRRLDISLGAYPEVSLKESRKRATSCRNQVLQGHKPIADWKILKQETTASIKPLFKDYAIECISAKKGEWKNPKHTEQWFNTIKDYANPVIGNKPLDEIDTEDILKILNPIWHTKTETASRLRGRIEWILASATTRKYRSGSNPAAWRGHLATILPKPTKITKIQHHPALPYKELPGLMLILRESDSVSALALEFLILNANRTGEIISGLRSEIVDELWVIPANRMKGDREHRIPLRKRSLEILEIARSLDPNSEYLFSNNDKPLSNMAMPMLLRRLNLDITVHGFRSTFRDWVSEETLHSPEAAEKAMAHAIRNQVEAAYRRGDLLEHRKRLMDDWECYCLTGKWGKVNEINERLEI